MSQREFFANLQQASMTWHRRALPIRVWQCVGICRNFKHIPVREMIKRGWLELSDAGMIETQLAQFFCVEGPSDIPRILAPMPQRKALLCGRTGDSPGLSWLGYSGFGRSLGRYLLPDIHRDSIAERNERRFETFTVCP